MHTTVLSCQFRAAALGSRFSANLAPFAYAGSTMAPFCQQQQQQQKKTLVTKLLQKRSTSSYSMKADTSCTSMAATRTYQASPLLLKSSQFCSARPLTVAKRDVGSSIRANSTSTRPKTSTNSDDAAQLDWNTFFKLRASRRRYSLVSSILASLASTAIGVQLLSTQDFDSLGAQVMGLDPFVVLGLATAACGALGWLAGPFLGNGLWRLVHRRFQRGVAIKEKEFFDRIKRFRVDPSSNSLANPVPDYYGEKIGSVQGYRQWLKDQRAYNRKRSRFIL